MKNPKNPKSLKNLNIKKLGNIQEKSRQVEIFTGAYTSGKSEIAINRALMLKNEVLPVTLVDLDTVEPAYTLRPLKKELENLGLHVVTQEKYVGQGEAGNVITGEQQNCLLNKGNIVIDVGYGAGGLDILNIIPHIDKEKNFEIYIVINTSKPETSTVESIVEYTRWSLGVGTQSWKKFSGIISNTHFGDQTTKEDVIKGYEITKLAAKELDLPIRALAVEENIYPELEYLICKGISVWSLKRFMPKALW